MRRARAARGRCTARSCAGRAAPPASTYALLVGIPDHQIGVEARRDAPLARRQPGQPRRRRAHPGGDVGERRGRAARASVQTAGSPSCSDAMPPQARWKSPRSAQLERGRARAVIGDHEIDHAVEQRAPERLAVLALADRRRALELGGAVGDRLGLEAQVVRAGLDRDRQALGLGARATAAATTPTTGARCAPRSRVSRHSSTSSAIAASSQARGRDAR